MSVLPKIQKKLLNDLFKKSLEKNIETYVNNTVKSNILKNHTEMMRDAKEKEIKMNNIAIKKIFKEDNIAIEYFRKSIMEDGEVPTNAMGASSSTEGPIQTFDPILSKKKMKRKIPAKENIK
jgi:hypothetical protein